MSGATELSARVTAIAQQQLNDPILVGKLTKGANALMRSLSEGGDHRAVSLASDLLQELGCNQLAIDVTSFASRFTVVPLAGTAPLADAAAPRGSDSGTLQNAQDMALRFSDSTPRQMYSTVQTPKTPMQRFFSQTPLGRSGTQSPAPSRQFMGLDGQIHGGSGGSSSDRNSIRSNHRAANMYSAMQRGDTDASVDEMLPAVAAGMRGVHSSLLASTRYRTASADREGGTIEGTARLGNAHDVAVTLGLPVGEDDLNRLDYEAPVGSRDVSNLDASTLNLMRSDCFRVANENLAEQIVQWYGRNNAVKAWIDTVEDPEAMLANNASFDAFPGEQADEVLVSRVEMMPLVKKRKFETAADYDGMWRSYDGYRGRHISEHLKGRHPLNQLIYDSGIKEFFLFLLYYSWSVETELRNETMREVSGSDVSTSQVAAKLVDRLNRLATWKGKTSSTKETPQQQVQKKHAVHQLEAGKLADLAFDYSVQFPHSFKSGNELTFFHKATLLEVRDSMLQAGLTPPVASQCTRYAAKVMFSFDGDLKNWEMWRTSLDGSSSFDGSSYLYSARHLYKAEAKPL